MFCVKGNDLGESDIMDAKIGQNGITNGIRE